MEGGQMSPYLCLPRFEFLAISNRMCLKMRARCITAKMAQSIEMPFGSWAPETMDFRFPWEGVIFGGKGIAKYMDCLL